MRLTVNGLRSFLVRSFRKAEDLTSVLVEPVPVVLNPLVVLVCMSFLWASATASAVNPSTALWWSMNNGMVP